MFSFETLTRASIAGVFAAIGPLAVALALAGPAAATPITKTTWNTFTNCSEIVPVSATCPGDPNITLGNEDQFTAVSGNAGVLKAAAYHITTGSNGLPTATGLVKDYLGYYSGPNYGIGVENIGSPNHSVDNSGQYDFIVFQLPAGVNTLSVKVSPFNTTENMNVTMFWGTPTANSTLANLITANGGGATGFAGVKVSDLTSANGFATTHTTDLFSETTIVTLPTVTSYTNAQYLIVAASLTPVQTKKNGVITYQEVDDFKISAIVGSYTAHAPEPASWAMFAAGLLGFGAMARRRARKA